MKFGSFFAKKFPSKNDSRQFGQTLVFFALLVPILFLFAGVTIDLGWYYLNVSRLQNAADAAVLAGAKELFEKLKDNNTKYKSYTVTLVYQHPRRQQSLHSPKHNQKFNPKLNQKRGRHYVRN